MADITNQYYLTGLESALPSLAVGVVAFTTDTGKLYVGSSGGNVLIGPTSTGGTVTSVDVSGGTTGLTTSGGPITTSGTITLGGTLALANGGTGATDASGARAALGLGDCATLDVGTGSGEVAAGDHTHSGVYQPLDATLTALAGVTTAADKLIYATGSDTFSTTTITAFGRSLIDDADSTTARGTLGLGNSATLNTGTTAGTVATGDHTHTGVYQPAGSYQPLDSTLTALAGVSTSANQAIYATGSDTFSTTSFTEAARYRSGYTTQSVSSSPSTPTSDTYYLADVSSGNIQLNLPSAVVGMRLKVTVVDDGGTGNNFSFNFDSSQVFITDELKYTGVSYGIKAYKFDTIEVEQVLGNTWVVIYDGRKNNIGLSGTTNKCFPYYDTQKTKSTSILSDPGRSRVAYVQSTITADPTDPTTDTHYLCDPSSASFTVTLPAASTFGAGKRLLFTLTATSSNRTVTLDPNSTETILCRDGTPTTVVLYVAGDVVEIESDGTNWVMVRDGRIPHKCQIVRSTAQSIANDTDTKVSMNTSVFDVGGMSDITNSRIVVRRSGIYTMSSMWGTPAVMNAGTRSQLLAKVNSNNVGQMLLYSASVSAYLLVDLHKTISLASGDIVEMYIFQDSGSSLNTETSSLRRPCLTLTEIL